MYIMNVSIHNTRYITEPICFTFTKTWVRYFIIGSDETMLCIYIFTCNLGVWGLNYVAFSLKHEACCLYKYLNG